MEGYDVGFEECVLTKLIVVVVFVTDCAGVVGFTDYREP
jgi:hypothetical protein